MPLCLFRIIRSNCMLLQARRTLGQKGGEWTAVQNTRLLTKMDKNMDGRISRSEFTEHFEQALHMTT